MKILIAMSGGVDSSVAAGLLCKDGNECIGATMKLYHNEDAGIPRAHTCCSLDDVEDARSVCYKLGIPYYVFNFSDDFGEKIIDKFVRSYEAGLTPNPCIDCNRYMKFDKLYQRAEILGCDHIATGHYARITFENGQYQLRKALDETKDQSYVLYDMTQQRLARTLFPLGELRKTEARDLAREADFINADKPDSQDICFVPDGDYAKIIELRTGKKSEPGNFVDKSGSILGRHNGIIRYTIGQHRGLGLSLSQKYYVCEIRPEDNTVVLGESADLFHRGVQVQDMHWIAGSAPEKVFRCKAKLRYRHPEQPVCVTVQEDGRVQLMFDEPQRAPTPGQYAVLYDGDIVLGGGVILRAFDPDEKEALL